jgi:hypothetical protein
MYSASPTRYDSMPYRASGKSGLKLPSITLGLWHNFGDTTARPTAAQKPTSANTCAAISAPTATSC